MLPRIVCVDNGSSGIQEAVVLVRGYMYRKARENRGEWLRSIRAAGFRGDVFELQWDASDPKRFLTNVMGFRDWKNLKRQARETGRSQMPVLLQELNDRRISLIGVSAGARIIYHALSSGELSGLSIHHAVLLGAAIRRRGESKDWSRAAESLSGNLINVYSKRDTVLATAYKATNLGKSPCGLGPIRASDPNIVNLDATQIVRGGFLHLAAHGRYQVALSQEVGSLLWHSPRVPGLVATTMPPPAQAAS